MLKTSPRGSHLYGPTTPIPFDTVHQAFEAIVDNYPEAIAVSYNGSQLSYIQVEVAANRMANYLVSSGLRPGQPVCLVLQRSLEMIIAILAVLKSGCYYVPIDGGVVSEKALQHILKDTAARFVLCLPRYWDKVRQHAPREAIILDLGLDIGGFYSHHRPSIPVFADDNLYVMYTSGSTGMPKGVEVKHRSMTNALLTQPGNLNVGIGSKVAQVLSISFAMAKYNERDFPSIKTVAVAGEPCSQTLADEWGVNRAFYNFLGSTEVFLFSAHKHYKGMPMTIGKPLPNVRCYILDDKGEIMIAGQRGTLWVGGAGISRGYLNLPLTTAEKYKHDRFANDGTLMYNFGNVVCLRPDGSLESFGRMDDQVKIKGFRVELDGVTAVIEEFPGITQATTVIIDDVLHGFYTSADLINEQQLISFVRNHLPYYSVPEYWMRMSTIPLNANGKIDKLKLKARVGNQKEMAEANMMGTVSTSSDCASSVVSTKSILSSKPSRTKTYPLPLSGPSNADNHVKSGLYESSSTSSPASTSKENASVRDLHDLPQPKMSSVETSMRYRVLISYRWFLLIIVVANAAVACWLLERYIRQNQYPISAVATATATNLTAAVLIRSEPIINILFWTFSSMPRWMPLSIRRACAQVYHIGGIHSGCALAAIIWFIAFTAGASIELAKDVRLLSLPSILMSYPIIVLLLAMSILSYPTIRAKYHDLWEMMHRFGGWTVLILYWILVGFVTRDLAANSSLSTSEAYLRNPSVWLLAVTTIAIIFPWLLLRRVPVRSEVLSSHAIQLHFDYTNLRPGQGVRLAEKPLADWHGFATITASVTQDKGTHVEGFSVIVSRAGDFTGRTIDSAPKYIWKRGIPTCGVLRIATLFKSVVLVATGSGIGPCLSIFPFNVKMHILWTAPNPEETFGQKIIEYVRKRDPGAVIHNTRTQGKPNMALLAYDLYRSTGAEAVLVISNKSLTKKIVYEMERRSVPAYGAIFDS